MTELLFRDDPYLTDAEAVVLAHTPEGGIVVSASIFYPTGGGQPGDSGWIEWDGGRLAIATAVKVDGGVALIPAEARAMPAVGAPVRQRLAWERRFGHMRVHTALHLLSVVIPLPVTGGQIVEFVQAFSTWSAGGEIRIGNVLIDTDYTEVEELEEEEY